MIHKPAIIITSIGRTGTKFFSFLFESILPNSTSLHEPDVINFFQYDGIIKKINNLIHQIKASGFNNLFLRKALGHWSLVELSDSRFRCEVSDQAASNEILRQRANFILSTCGIPYVESSIAYYGLIDILVDVFSEHRLVYLIRDGRDWVRSEMSWGQMYGKPGILRGIAHTWPRASELKNDVYSAQWAHMNRFERLCWAWTAMNRYALETLEKNPSARLFYFEDIFQHNDRYQHLTDLVSFSTSHLAKPLSSAADLEGWLERRVHQSRDIFPPWSEWSSQQKTQFETICGPLMSSLGYSDSRSR